MSKIRAASAMSTLRDLGLINDKKEPSPIIGLLDQINGLDDTKVALIARTLDQMSVFNEVVREHVAAMEVGDRYRQITEGFNSIRDDAKAMVDQIADAAALRNYAPLPAARGDFLLRAGRKAEVGTLFAESADNFKAYGVKGHRHSPEIEQGLSLIHGAPVKLTGFPACAMGSAVKVTASVAGRVTPRAVRSPDTVPRVGLASLSERPTKLIIGYFSTQKNFSPLSRPSVTRSRCSRSCSGCGSRGARKRARTMALKV